MKNKPASLLMPQGKALGGIPIFWNGRQMAGNSSASSLSRFDVRDVPIPNFLPVPIPILKKIPIPMPILAYLTQAKKNTFLQFNEIS